MAVGPEDQRASTEQRAESEEDLEQNRNARDHG
jgi:hypothetical protein